MEKKIVLTEYPNLEKYPKVETMLDSESMCGYTQRTTFWDDFTIAEKWGVKAIEDTYKNAFQSWKYDLVFIVELVLVLNWKMWYMAEKRRLSEEMVYCKCWEELCEWCKNHLKGEAYSYYTEVTD